MDSPFDGDDEEIKRLLTGNNEEVAEGLNRVDQRYRYRICGLLRVCFPQMLSEDLSEVWQETLVSLYSMADSGRFDLEGSIEGLLRTMASRRGQDRMRRNAAWQRPIDALVKDLKEPQLVEKWQALKALQGGEAIELVNESVEKLPPRQKLIWRVYVAHYPDSAQLDYLTEQVRKVIGSQGADGGVEESGTTLSKKAVSSALHAGRAKIREDLKRKGYDL